VCDSEAVVRLLLEKGTDVESGDAYDRTPPQWAAKKGHEAVVKLLRAPRNFYIEKG
jgi:ankyrin repeat protein